MSDVRPDWALTSEQFMECIELRNNPPRVSRWSDARPLIARLLVIIARVFRAYDGARSTVYAYESRYERIRAACAIHETAPQHTFYPTQNNSPIVGWKPHHFSAPMDMASTSAIEPPPPLCDICGALQTAEWHSRALATNSQEKRA